MSTSSSSSSYVDDDDDLQPTKLSTIFLLRNSREHVQPFVLVQFRNLMYDRLVNVECRAWAPNIIQSTEGKERRGAVTFNIFRTQRA